MRLQWLSIATLLVLTSCSVFPRQPAPIRLRPADVRLHAAVKPADPWLREHNHAAPPWMLEVELSSAGPPLLAKDDSYSYMVYAFDGEANVQPSDWGETPGRSQRAPDAIDHYLIAADGLSWEAAVRNAQGSGDLPATVSTLQLGYGFRNDGTRSTAKVRYVLGGKQPPARRIALVFVSIGPPPARKPLWTASFHATAPD